MRIHLIVLPLLAVSLAGQATWIVDSGNPGALPNLAAAVAVAADGDIIEVQHASEAMLGNLVIDKSLRIIGNVQGDATQFLFVNGGGLEVQLPAGKELVLANCQLTTWWGAGLPPPGLVIIDCAGRVVVQDLPNSNSPVTILRSDDVFWSRVELTATTPMQIADSTVVFDRCTLIGRSADYEHGRPSTHAMQINDAVVHCVDTFVGGGNAAWHLGGWEPNMPGTRALASVASFVTMAGDDTLVTSGNFTTLPPVQSTGTTFVFPLNFSPAIDGTATVTHLQLPSVDVAASSQSLSLTVRSPLGSLSGLLFGSPGDRTAIPAVLGDLWLDPLSLCTPLAGIQNGSLTWTVALPPSPVLFGQSYRWQGIALLGATIVLGAPGGTVMR